jgi:hypothetical protein
MVEDSQGQREERSLIPFSRKALGKSFGFRLGVAIGRLFGSWRKQVRRRLRRLT